MKFSVLFLALCTLSLANALFDDVEVFDYVIIGGGAAGSLMASRLSEDPTKTVLVLHRGTDEVRIQLSIFTMETVN